MVSGMLVSSIVYDEKVNESMVVYLTIKCIICEKRVDNSFS